MRTCSLIAIFIFAHSSFVVGADLPKPMATGLKNPESVCVGPRGAVYVTEIGDFDKNGDGQVSIISGGKATPFATGLDDPKGIVASQNALFVADKTKIVRIDMAGKVTPFVTADKFPTPAQFLNDLAIDVQGNVLFASDSGNFQGAGGAVYRIDLRSGKVDLIADAKSLPGLHTPNGLALDGVSHLLMVDFGTGTLHRIKLADRSHQKVAEGFDGCDGVTWDYFGKLFVTSWKTGKVVGIARPGQKAVALPYQFGQSADACVDATGLNLLIPDMKAGTVTAIPAAVPGWDVDESPLPIHTEPTFTSLKWTGFSPTDDTGVVRDLRPMLLTHAGDGTNRLYVPTQRGVIHSFPNDPAAAATTVFLDISDRVRYREKMNEEGLLGLVFHPQFKTNGEFFVFYTDVKAKMANVLSRFRVSKTDPTKGDPATEEELLRFEKPFWNHDGGTVVFGPDGYLYVTHGDGGAGGDPQENGQKLTTHLGKVLRIDVNRKANGKNYAIPADNPFVSRPDVSPEIWAYGIRNIWRMAFDRQTGKLWAGEVGQNLFEEINILKAGGNYGWSIRESFHPFGNKGVDVRPDLIEPIWEYHHDIGKSITGGLVYRGKKLPELKGAYLYADYVSNRVWALWYDEAKGRVVANREIKGPGVPVVSFGEDADGEAYIITMNSATQGIHRLVK